MTSDATYTEQLRRELVGASRRLGANSERAALSHGEGARHDPRAAASNRMGRGRVLAVAAAALSLAAVIVAIAALGSGGGGPTAAYAVTQNPDGTVTLTLSEVLGVEPANEQLARLGVPVVVAKIEPGCDERGETVRPTEPRLNEMIEPAKSGPGLGGLTWVIHPSVIPPGDSVRLSVQLDPDSSIPALGAGMALFRGAAPRCSRPATFYPG
jgi:hypothetical protein